MNLSTTPPGQSACSTAVHLNTTISSDTNGYFIIMVTFVDDYFSSGWLSWIVINIFGCIGTQHIFYLWPRCDITAGRGYMCNTCEIGLKTSTSGKWKRCYTLRRCYNNYVGEILCKLCFTFFNSMQNIWCLMNDDPNFSHDKVCMMLLPADFVF